MAIGSFITLTRGVRPPIEPPIRTGFDADSSGDDVFAYYRDQLRYLKKLIVDTDLDPDTFALYKELIDRRIAWLENDLAHYRMINAKELPPSFMSFIDLDSVVGRDSTEKKFLGLIADFEDLGESLSNKIYDLRDLRL